MINPKRRYFPPVAALVLGIALLPALSHAQDYAPQTVELVTVDVQKLSTGYRMSKLIGANVVNDNGDTIGKIDDFIVSPEDNRTANVILSVGGWLGMGTRLVAIPYDSLRISGNKITLPGATKDSLKNLPEFKYATK